MCVHIDIKSFCSCTVHACTFHKYFRKYLCVLPTHDHPFKWSECYSSLKNVGMMQAHSSRNVRRWTMCVHMAAWRDSRPYCVCVHFVLSSCGHDVLFCHAWSTRQLQLHAKTACQGLLSTRREQTVPMLLFSGKKCHAFSLSIRCTVCVQTGYHTSPKRMNYHML